MVYIRCRNSYSCLLYTSFIARFSSNASKAKQATSRKKQLDKLQVEDIQPSRRRYPYVGFTPEREIGNEVPVSYTHLDVYKRQIYS